MKITHVVTFDQGSGPTSLVEIAEGEDVRMLRVTHTARFDKVKEVDAAAARQAIERSANLGKATTRVRPEHARALAQEALRFAAGMGCTSQGLRWGEEGEATLFRTEADAVAWDQTNSQQLAEAPTRPRMIMG